MFNSQMHVPRTIVSREPWVPEQNPTISCEILPVALSSGQIYYLRRRNDSVGGAWHEPHVSAHPSELVRAHLEAFLGFSLDPQASVVHSTAWRYECGGSAGGRLILTYLVVLAPVCCLPLSHLTGQISLEPLPLAQPARSETLMPPTRIGLEHVLAHALDHLTLLMETDAAIHAALGDAWRTALHRRLPRPAGELRLAQ
ncbi:MAG: hypothetical protein WCF99_17995 [Chloroflexales bacterium]